MAEFVEAARNFTDAQAYLAAQERRRRAPPRGSEWFERDGVDLVLEPTLPILPLGAARATSAATRPARAIR